MPTVVRLAFESVFTVVFPSFCKICVAPLTTVSRVPVCEACQAGVTPVRGALCRICGECLSPSFTGVVEHAACALCTQEAPPFSKAVAYGSYDGVLRDLLHLLKYDRVYPAAGVLARHLAGAIARLPLPKQVLVAPVPLHRIRLAERGFNQAEALARSALKVLCHADRQRKLTLAPGLLRRVRATVTQTGLTRPQRRDNIRGAFVVAKPEMVSDRNVLLIDDVYTTGTTLSECAWVLRKAGADSVWVATVARVQKYGSMESLQELVS